MDGWMDVALVCISCSLGMYGILGMFRMYGLVCVCALM